MIILYSKEFVVSVASEEEYCINLAPWDDCNIQYFDEILRRNQCISRRVSSHFSSSSREFVTICQLSTSHRIFLHDRLRFYLFLRHCYIFGFDEARKSQGPNQRKLVKFRTHIAFEAFGETY